MFQISTVVERGFFRLRREFAGLGAFLYLVIPGDVGTSFGKRSYQTCWRVPAGIFIGAPARAEAKGTAVPRVLGFKQRVDLAEGGGLRVTPLVYTYIEEVVCIHLPGSRRLSTKDDLALDLSTRGCRNKNDAIRRMRVSPATP